MDFALTDEQELLRSSARTLLEGECPPALVRAHADDPSVTSPLFDRHLREWVALGDGPLVDLTLFSEEAGAVLLPGPFFTTTSLFAPLLAACGHADAAAASAGEVTGTVEHIGPALFDATALTPTTAPLSIWTLRPHKIAPARFPDRSPVLRC